MEKGVCLDNDVDSEDGDNFSDSVNVCIIEIGCGLRVPSIRMETETVLADILNKLTGKICIFQLAFILCMCVQHI